MQNKSLDTVILYKKITYLECIKKHAKKNKHKKVQLLLEQLDHDAIIKMLLLTAEIKNNNLKKQVIREIQARIIGF